MKTKYKLIALLLCAGSLSFTSCNYLDIVPDEVATEADAFKNKEAAQNYLYSCYSYIPNCRNAVSSLDFMTGDEVVTPYEHETFANFPKGNYTASAPVISYWNTLFQGIRQCYIMKNNVATTPGIEASTVAEYKAQADFLIAYYHFLLIRSYGPTILVKEEPLLNTDQKDYLGRSSYDECVQWVCDLLDKAAAELPATRVGQELGLATSNAALSIKARLLLYAASPLFNGNAEYYSNFKNKDGKELISTTYDANKWVKAMNANKAAIDAAHAAGYRLYEPADATNTSLPEPTDPVQRALRFTIVDQTTKEIIWAETRTEGGYGLQNKSTPYMSGDSWNGVSPTLTMLERFYTKNGLPIEQDTTFNYSHRYDAATFAPNDSLYGEGKTQVMNIGREPRYYAWVAFHGGYYECQGSGTATESSSSPYYKTNKRGINGLKVLTKFLKNDPCGRGTRNNDYSPTGFLNKKGVSPAATANNSIGVDDNSPWPVVRLAELYLNYAEACVECDQLDEAMTYLNKVRTRAGIPTVQDAWGKIGVALTKDKLREIVRQERMIELYLENQNFWDMRRWKLADKYFSVKPMGMTTTATIFANFIKPVEIPVTRSFTSPTQYLMPIPYSEIQKNQNLVQNPGY